MSLIITCPSGLTGSIRSMTVEEERILADRKLARDGLQLDSLLEACWESTADPGLYDFGAKTIDWSKVLQGDRFFALLQVRSLTYGPEYAFSVMCSNSSCKARIEWELKLTDLRVQELSDESRKALLGGNRFETRLPEAGRGAWFKLMTGADEKRLQKMRPMMGERPLSSALLFRVIEVEGIEQKELRPFIEKLAMRDALHLMREFDRVDCGVDTSVEIECPSCFFVQELDLPFERGFLLPGKKERGPRSFSQP